MAEALITGALVDLARAKQYLQRPKDGGAVNTENDEMITQGINYVTGQIRAYCGRTQLISGTVTNQLHNGSGTNELRTREYPVVSVSAITEVLEDGAATTRALTISPIILKAERTIVLPLDTFTKGFQNIRITYVAGYGSNSADQKALQGATLRLLQVWWQDYEHAIGRGVAFGVGGQSANLIETAIPKDIERALSPYRRIY